MHLKLPPHLNSDESGVREIFRLFPNASKITMLPRRADRRGTSLLVVLARFSQAIAGRLLARSPQSPPLAAGIQMLQTSFSPTFPRRLLPFLILGE